MRIFISHCATAFMPELFGWVPGPRVFLGQIVGALQDARGSDILVLALEA